MLAQRRQPYSLSILALPSSVHLPKVLFLVSLNPSAAFICPKELKASHGGSDAGDASAGAVFVEPVAVAPLASLTWTALDFSA